MVSRAKVYSDKSHLMCLVKLLVLFPADIDECGTANNCSDQADCHNFIGGYSCICRTGYSGNGTNCDGMW